MLEKKERGSILILSLWVLVLLGVLSTGIALRGRLEAQILKIRQFRNTSPYFALSQVNYSRVLIESDTDQDTDSRLDSWYGVSDSPFPYSVAIRDEEAKLNLNSVPAGVLELFFERIHQKGVKLKTKPEMWIAGILYWRGASWIKQRPQFGVVYKKTPFESVEELYLIPGIDTRDVSVIEPYFTIYPALHQNAFKININTTSDFILSIVIDSIHGDVFAAATIKEKIFQFREGKLEGPEQSHVRHFSKGDLTAERILYRLQLNRTLQLLHIANQLCAYATVNSQFFSVRVQWPTGSTNPFGVEAILGPKGTQENKLSIMAWQRL